MRDVLVSIRPEYAAMIYAGTKTVEFRRRLPDAAGGWRRFYIYETKPVAMVTGWAEVTGASVAPVDVIWGVFGKNGGIHHDDFMTYMGGSKSAWALLLRRVYPFAEPLPLSSFGVDRAPQSWRYIYH